MSWNLRHLSSFPTTYSTLCILLFSFVMKQRLRKDPNPQLSRLATSVQCFCLAMVSLARSRWRSLPATCKKAAQGDQSMFFWRSHLFIWDHVSSYLFISFHLLMFWKDFRDLCSFNPSARVLCASCLIKVIVRVVVLVLILVIVRVWVAIPLLTLRPIAHSIVTVFLQQPLYYSEMHVCDMAIKFPLCACGLVLQKLHVISCDIVLFL